MKGLPDYLRENIAHLPLKTIFPPRNRLGEILIKISHILFSNRQKKPARRPAGMHLYRSSQ